MECENCNTIKNKMICKSCIKIEIRNFRKDQSLGEHERKIIIKRLASQWPTQLNILQAQRAKLKQSIDYNSELKSQISEAVAQANNRIKYLQEENMVRKERLDIVRKNYQTYTALVNNQQNTRETKLKEGDKVAQQRLHQTRRALISSLGELGIHTIILPTISSSKKTTLNKETRTEDTARSSNLNTNIDYLKATSNEIQTVARRSSRNDRGLQLRNNSEPLGGVFFSLHITVLVARYLGVSIPFDTKVIGPFSTIYLKHDYPDYQEFNSIPLYEIESKREYKELLKIMVSYNQIYLHYLQLLSHGVNPKLNNLTEYSLEGIGTEGLIMFLESCKRGWGNKTLNSNALLGSGIDPTFRPDFHQFLWKMKGAANAVGKKGVYTVHENHFSSEIPSSLLDEDYDTDFSHSQLPPAHKLTSSNDGKAGVEKPDLEDEAWESVDVVLPPTPAELEAFGI
ncbi:hypothetical protein K502DRAFT_350949 [Neoconidiobolus thromboides FSU 785]|nr:hypothetical protein K502DRAFT_350949 [Neoconidiobolus thromboides FSU 785]